MITENVQELFDNIMKELLAIRTDITIMKYDIEQIQNKLDNNLERPTATLDPMLDLNNPNVHRL